MKARRMFNLEFGRVLVAVSGGIDSTVLLHMLYSQGLDLGVIHINHQTRGEENIKEEALVREMASSFSIPFYSFKYEEISSGNFHENARTFRLNQYQKVAEENGYECVALAHHYDDQLENILLKEKRIIPSLMETITEFNDFKIYRPLLEYRKSELQEYAIKHNISFLEDSSNRELVYKRNKIRDKLSRYDEAEKEELYTNAIRKNEEFTDVVKDLTDITKSGVIEAKYLNSELKVYAFLKINDISSNISKNLLTLILSGIKSRKNVKISVDGSNTLHISYGKVYIYNVDTERIERVMEQKALDGVNVFNGLRFVHDASRSSGDVRIRTFIPGDVWNKDEGITKKVSRIFIDQKVDRCLRSHWPILVDARGNIKYVPSKSEVEVLRDLKEYINE